VQAFVCDQRIGHAEREDLKARIDLLVHEQHLESNYAELCKKQGIEV